jgi:TolA-binding protein
MTRRASLLIFVFLFALSCNGSNLDKKMSLADEHMGMGDWNGAREYFEKAVKGCPEYERCAEALIKLGDLYSHALGRPKKAHEEYARVIKYFPLRDAARVARERRAQMFEKVEDFLGASNEYARLIQYFPNSDQVSRYLLKLGESYVALGNYEQARIELSGFIKSIDIDPEIRQEALFVFAETYFLEGRLGLAEMAYKNLIEEYPDSKLVPEAQMKIATCQEERGFLGYATKTLMEARDEYPNQVALDRRLSAMKKRGKGKPPEALVKEKEAAKEEPGVGSKGNQ